MKKLQMRLRLLTVLLLLLTMPAWAQTAQTDTTTTAHNNTNNDDEAMMGEANLPWPLGMQASLDSMMRHPLLDYTQIGLMVWDLTDNRSLFACNHRQLLRPASTMKVLTAVTALDVLGGDYRFTTSLYYKGEIRGRTLWGDLYCVGGMDPAFSRDDLLEFAEDLRRVGIDTISGRVVADVSMKDTLKWGEGWCWDDKNPTLTPLLVDRKDGFTAQFINAMTGRGVTLRDVSLAEGVLPKDAVLISQRQRTIDQILERMMKDSDNLYAEAVYYQIAAREGRGARALYAQRQQRALMERAGLNSSRYRLADGSGLSLYNYLSAEAETMVLRYAFLRPAVYSHLVASLPVAGVDGTLKKRMKGTPAEGNVRAKTGTLTGIISLAGYCTAANGHLLCFAIINQGVQSAREARDFQDRVCTILCR